MAISESPANGSESLETAYRSDASYILSLAPALFIVGMIIELSAHWRSGHAILIWSHLLFAITSLGLLVGLKLRKTALPKPEFGLLVIWACMFGSVFAHFAVRYPHELESTLLVLSLSVVATGALILPTVAGYFAFTLSVGILITAFAISNPDEFFEKISIPLLASVIALLAFLARRWAIRQTIQKQQLDHLLQEKEAKLQTANEVAEMAIRLSAGLSHHFNNRLQSVMLGASGAKSLIGDEHPASKHLSLVLEAAQRGTDITKHLINYAQQTPLNRTRVSAQAFLNEINLEAELSDQTRLKSSVDDGFIYADIAQLAIVLQELVTNADRAIGTTGGSIELNLRTSPDASTHITVIDDGIGIPDSIANSLTDPFVTSSPVTQLGLGLTFAQQVVLRHGGQISFSRSSTGGTKVELYFPVGDHRTESE